MSKDHPGGGLMVSIGDWCPALGIARAVCLPPRYAPLQRVRIVTTMAKDDVHQNTERCCGGC
jgi:hypothetical protein